MALNAIPVLAIVIFGLTFEGLIFGSEIASQSFPQFKTVDYGSCSPNSDDPTVGGTVLAIVTLGLVSATADPLGYIGCIIGNTFNILVNVVLGVFGGIFFFFNLISFNVPGTPWYIRTVLGSLLGGTLTWAIVGMLRGN